MVVFEVKIYVVMQCNQWCPAEKRMSLMVLWANQNVEGAEALNLLFTEGFDGLEIDLFLLISDEKM